jgi:hypothetical protein
VLFFFSPRTDGLRGPRVVRRNATYALNPITQRFNRGYLDELVERPVRFMYFWKADPAKLRVFTNSWNQV